MTADSGYNKHAQHNTLFFSIFLWDELGVKYLALSTKPIMDPFRVMNITIETENYQKDMNRSSSL